MTTAAVTRLAGLAPDITSGGTAQEDTGFVVFGVAVPTAGALQLFDAGVRGYGPGVRPRCRLRLNPELLTW